MRRRQFMEGVALTGGALLLDRSESSAARLPFVPGPAVPRFRFLTDDPAFLDDRSHYRTPAFPNTTRDADRRARNNWCCRRSKS